MSDWKALDILGAAHRVGLEKLKAMEADIERLRKGEVAEAAAGLRGMFAFFNGELKTHFLQEEDALFPALSRTIGPMGPVQVMLDEHRSLWLAVDVLEESLDALDQGELGARDEVERVALRIVWALRSHIQKEDEMLFPAAQHYLQEPERQEVNRRIETTFLR